MTAQKRQHFIPCFHLKHFIGQEPNGHVWTYDSKTGKVHHAVPEQTAVETHFYSVENAGGTMNIGIEQELAEIESSAAPVYGRLLQGLLPERTQERADFSTFLSIMYLRSPAMRRMNAEFIGRNAQMRKPTMDPKNYIIEVRRERTLRVLGISDKLAPILFHMKWSLAFAGHGFFITSDNPLVRQVDPRSCHPVYGDRGFLNKTAEILFPLSPKLLLLLSWNKGAREIGVMKRHSVDSANSALAANSERYLYSHLRHKRLIRLTEEFKDSRPGMTMHGFEPDEIAQVQLSRRSRRQSGSSVNR